MSVINIVLLSIIGIVFALFLASNAMLLRYKWLYKKEIDNGLKYKVEVKELVLEHSRVADEVQQFNAYSR